jgi:hypothetical protein
VRSGWLAVVVAIGVASGVGSGSAVAASGGNLAKAKTICLAGDKAVAGLLKPTGQSAAEYATHLAQALAIASRSLGRIRALHWSSTVRNALAVEAAGVKLEKQEVPALKRGDVALATQIGNRADTLTHPADLVLRRAGLAVCLGSG